MKPEPRNESAIGLEQYSISYLSTSKPQQGHVLTTIIFIILSFLPMGPSPFFLSGAVLLANAWVFAISQSHGMANGL